MTTLRRTLIVLLGVAMLATGMANAVSTANFSDQWWVPTESGWGVSVLQQSNTLFVELMMYGSDGKPTWLTAVASMQPNALDGHTTFAGDLFATTGPYHGGSFNPSLVASRRVGALTFDATTADNVTLSYTVDGTPVVKNLTRQTWRQENLEGTYDAFWVNNCGGYSAFDWEPALMVVRHESNNRVVISLSCPYCWTNFNHELRGNYVQSGHLGQVTAELIAPDMGSITLIEIETTKVGFTGRFRGTITSSGETCQVTNGRVGALRQQ